MIATRRKMLNKIVTNPKIFRARSDFRKLKTALSFSPTPGPFALRFFLVDELAEPVLFDLLSAGLLLLFALLLALAMVGYSCYFLIDMCLYSAEKQWT